MRSSEPTKSQSSNWGKTNIKECNHQYDFQYDLYTYEFSIVISSWSGTWTVNTESWGKDASISKHLDGELWRKTEFLLNLTFQTRDWVAWRHSSPCQISSWTQGGGRGRGRPCRWCPWCAGRWPSPHRRGPALGLARCSEGPAIGFVQHDDEAITWKILLKYK